MPDFLGFQYRVILDLYRILFHAVVIFGPAHDFLFKSASTYCDSVFNGSTTFRKKQKIKELVWSFSRMSRAKEAGGSKHKFAL